MALVRVATFNVLHGMAPHQGTTDPGLLQDAARTLDADVVGLQEVDRSQPRSGQVDQTALVAEALDAPWRRFVPALHGTPDESPRWSPATVGDGDGTIGPTYGIGMVSRLPVRSWWVKRFPAAPFRLPLVIPGEGRPRLLLIPDEPRLALAAVIEGTDGPFTVVTAHLSFVPGYNASQVRRIAVWVRRMPRPVVLMGDFNLPGKLPSWLTGWDSLATAPTYPAHRPKVQLDHILALGLAREEVWGQQVWRLPVSDHCALSADVDL
jgi:endonuclease/exonuclease/phosphatase family metal-dependent hydrolase